MIMTYAEFVRTIRQTFHEDYTKQKPLSHNEIDRIPCKSGAFQRLYFRVQVGLRVLLVLVLLLLAVDFAYFDGVIVQPQDSI